MTAAFGVVVACHSRRGVSEVPIGATTLSFDFDIQPHRPLGVEAYSAVLGRAHEAATAVLERYLRSDNSADYYFLQYAFDGALSMYEAGGDSRWLDWVVGRGYELIARARPTLDGELGWAWRNGNGGSNRLTGDNMLCEFQVARPLLRAARVARRVPGYADGEKAAALGEYVIDHILSKWEDRRLGSAGGQRPEALGNIAWLRDAEARPEWDCMLIKAVRLDHPWLDVWSMAGQLYVEAFLLTGLPRYRERALILADLFRRRKRVGADGAWTWDEGVYIGGWGERGANTAGAPDTGHANREVAWVVHAYLAGLGFDRDDVTALVRTLERRLTRPGKLPRFANYVNGIDTPYRGYSFGGTRASTAHVFDGWVRLSWVSREAQSLFEGLWAARAGGDVGHANATVWADLALPGHLGLAVAMHPR